MKKVKIISKILIALMLIFCVCYSILFVCAKYGSKIDIENSNSIYMYDKDNKSFYEGNNGTKKWIKLKDISKYLVNATIYSEDKNFYNHTGFDIPRIIKSIFINIKSKDLTQGASTITQQYARNLFLTFDKTWERKIKEAWYAFKLETQYSKDEILEGYLNTINYGQGNYGIANASRYYFNKEPIDLNLEESLILAGIPNSPGYYNPIANYDLSIKRAKIVGQSMVNNGKLTQEELDCLFKEKLEIYGKASEENLDMLMYYQDAVLQELRSLKTIPESLIQNGGIKIYTYLDVGAQETLEKNTIKYMKDTDLESASVIVDPNTGGVMALSGGVNYAKSQYNRATQAKRQVGSVMKPFLYYGALEEGMTASSTFNSQYTSFTLSNGSVYSPKNYGSIYANKPITMAEAIAVSDNVYAVKTNIFLGPDKLVEVAKKTGIKSELNAVPSLALGTSGISVLDLARGYNTFATGGFKKDVSLIRKVVDSEGNILYEKKDKTDLVLNVNNTYILNEMLTSTTKTQFKDYANPTALVIASQLSRKYAIKTGTTNSDYWTVGYNPDILMVTWTGYDDNRDVESNYAHLTKHIWADTVEEILHDKEARWYETPENVVGEVLDAVTGKTTKDTNKATLFYFVKGTENSFSDAEYVFKEQDIEE